MLLIKGLNSEACNVALECDIEIIITLIDRFSTEIVQINLHTTFRQ